MDEQVIENSLKEEINLPQVSSSVLYVIESPSRSDMISGSAIPLTNCP